MVGFAFFNGAWAIVYVSPESGIDYNEVEAEVVVVKRRSRADRPS